MLEQTLGEYQGRCGDSESDLKPMSSRSEISRLLVITYGIPSEFNEVDVWVAFWLEEMKK